MITNDAVAAAHAAVRATSADNAAAAETSKLNILFFTWNYFPAPAGGAERQARLQAEELVLRGHEVTVVCPRAPGTSSGVVGGVRVRRLFRINRRPFQRISYLVSIVVFALRHLRSFEIVHVHLANLQADVIVPLSRVLGVPSYVKVACGGSAGEVARLARVARFTRWVGLRRATVVQALSAEIVRELGSIGVDPTRIVRIPNGLPAVSCVARDEAAAAVARADLELPAAGLILLFVGRFAAYKGIEDLLAVWGRVEDHAAALVMVGAGDTESSIPVAPLRANLIVRDWTNEIRPYFDAADIFVYPSHADGMSNAVLEAMAAGCTIVASRSGATAEMLIDGESALLFECGDRDGLEAALERAMRNANLRRSLASQAAAAVTDFRIEAVVDRIESAYREAVVRS